MPDLVRATVRYDRPGYVRWWEAAAQAGPPPPALEPLLGPARNVSETWAMPHELVEAVQWAAKLPGWGPGPMEATTHPLAIERVDVAELRAGPSGQTAVYALPVGTRRYWAAWADHAGPLFGLVEALRGESRRPPEAGALWCECEEEALLALWALELGGPSTRTRYVFRPEELADDPADAMQALGRLQCEVDDQGLCVTLEIATEGPWGPQDCPWPELERDLRAIMAWMVARDARQQEEL